VKNDDSKLPTTIYRTWNRIWATGYFLHERILDFGNGTSIAENGESYHCSGTTEKNVVKYEKTGLNANRIHTLRVEVRKERNPDPTDCFQDVTFLHGVTPVKYPTEISRSISIE
jgi:hypothetical protein